MLPFLTLAFICGLTLGSLIPYFPFSILTALGLTAVGMTLLEANRRMTARRTTAWFGCLLLGIVYWFVVVESSVRPHVEDQKPEIFQSCTGRIIAPVQVNSDRLTALVQCDGTGNDAVQPLLIRLTWRSSERELFEGDRIAIRAKFHTPSGSLNPGGFDYAAYLERQGIDAVATVNGIEAVEVLESGRDSVRWAIWNRFDRWRAVIRQSAVQSLAQPALGLYLGVMIGERGYLDPEVRDQFMVTGTVHLLSISGSHLGLVAMLSFLAARRGLLYLPAVWLLALSRTITPTRVAAVATVIPVTIYACLAGAEVATVRSLLMVLVALMAKWLGYEQRMFHALAAAALAIVLHDPQAIYDISFQLSFLSVCAVAWWLTRPAMVSEEDAPSSRLSRTKQWTWEVLVMSAVVTLTTIPLVTYYFNQLPWLGLLTNVVAVPIMGGVLVPMGLFAILWQSVFGGDSLPFTEVIQWSMDMLVSVLRFISLIPGGEWHVAAPSIPTMVVFYGCLAALAVGSVRRSITWTAGVGLLVLLCWWIWSPRLWLDGDRFRITFLDVSQGDSAVLELPDGEVVLIDGGATYERFDMGRGVVAPYLWNRGIRSIDYVIATHPQLDHAGGLAYVLRHFEVRHFWGLGEAREEAFYRRLQEALAQRGLTEEVAREEQDTVVFGDCRLEVLNPSRIAVQQSASGRRPEGRALNNRSIVTQLSCGTHKVLFAADVEQEALSRLIRENRSERVDLLKVPHHGAGGSLHEEWIERLHPRYAVISVGRHNPYGHPAPAVLQAYAARGVALYRTDRDGGIWVTGARLQPALQVHRTSEETYQPCSFRDRFSACERLNWRRLIDRWQE